MSSMAPSSHYPVCVPQEMPVEHNSSVALNRDPSSESNTARSAMYSSSAFSADARPDEDWTQEPNLACRRRTQNRIAQRKYRRLKRERKLSDAAADSRNEPAPAIEAPGKRSRQQRPHHSIPSPPIRHNQASMVPGMMGGMPITYSSPPNEFAQTSAAGYMEPVYMTPTQQNQPTSTSSYINPSGLALTSGPEPPHMTMSSSLASQSSYLNQPHSLGGLSESSSSASLHSSSVSPHEPLMSVSPTTPGATMSTPENLMSSNFRTTGYSGTLPPIDNYNSFQLSSQYGSSYPYHGQSHHSQLSGYPPSQRPSTHRASHHMHLPPVDTCAYDPRLQ